MARYYKAINQIVIIASLLLFTQANAQDPKPGLLEESKLEILLDEIEETLGGLTSLRTEFRQEKHLSLFKEPVHAQGILYFAQPKSIRFEITEPYHSVLITNGKSVAQFEHINGRWKKLRSGGTEAIRLVTDQIASWFQGQLRQENDTYQITADAASPTVLHLTPTDEDFARFVGRIDITLNADRTQIDQIEIHEPTGDFTRINFESTERDPEVPQRLFKATGREPATLEE